MYAYVRRNSVIVFSKYGMNFSLAINPMSFLLNRRHPPMMVAFP